MALVERYGNYKVGKEGAEVSGRPQTMVKSPQCILNGQDVMLSSPRRCIATLEVVGNDEDEEKRAEVGPERARPCGRHHLHGVRGLDLLKKCFRLEQFSLSLSCTSTMNWELLSMITLKCGA